MRISSGGEEMGAGDARTSGPEADGKCWDAQQRALPWRAADSAFAHANVNVFLPLQLQT